MRALEQQEQAVIANLRAGLAAFLGFTEEERADYASEVRAQNLVRAEHEAAPVATPESSVKAPFVDVWYEDGFRMSRGVRVF